MGYTHYWKIKREIAPKTWAKIAKDAVALLGANLVPLTYGVDEEATPPNADTQEITFNGVGDDGYETFMLTAHPIAFEFTKTAEKPYDKMVCAVLIVAAKHAPGLISVSSDGWRSEWQPALDFVTQVLGEGYAIPKGVEPEPAPHPVQDLSADELKLRLYGKHGKVAP